MKTSTIVLLGSLMICCSSACKKETVTTEELVCEDACRAFNNDGECDDGGEGSETNLCKIGTDCSDCGERIVITEERVRR